MARKVTLPAKGSSGSTLPDVSTEEIGTLNGAALGETEQVQRMVLTVLAEGDNTTAVDVDAGAPLPVTLSGVATAAHQVTQNASLSTIEGHLDGVEGALAPLATSAKQDTIIGHLDGVEGALGARTLTPGSPTFATVGDSNGEAVAASGSRKRITLVNTSDNLISLGFGAAAAVLGSGITLTPGGGSVTLDEKAEGTTVLQGAINAIAGAAGSNLGVQAYS